MVYINAYLLILYNVQYNRKIKKKSFTQVWNPIDGLKNRKKINNLRRSLKRGYALRLPMSGYLQITNDNDNRG